MDVLPLHDKQSGLRSGAVKITLDEVRGYLNPTQAELNSLVAEVQARRLQAAIHAVEEPTVEAAIDAIAYAINKYPLRGHRHRIEHCSICTPVNAHKLASLGAVVVTNPPFIYYSGERYLATVPAGKIRHLYALKTMLGAGLHTAAGSDAPVSPPDPLKGIYAAVTRMAETGQKVAAGQAISFPDAATLYATGAAYSCFNELKMGTISRGKYADLVVLNIGPGQTGPEELKEARVDMTILAGKVAYRRAA
jgi:predicted amidohydrolase YtcJ